MAQMILGLETSCDDTSVAVLDLNGEVKSLVSANQDSSHRPFGGVVPEVASRQHTENLLPLVEQAMAEGGIAWPSITGIAVTSRPGLIGSLLVGVVSAKTLSLVRGIPFVGVNHIEGHLLAPLLRDASYGPPMGFDFPYVGLAVSGGHTHLFHCEAPGRYRLLGKTVDDAAGEAFDKFAKMMRLGFPGGLQVDRLAATGDRMAFKFPRAFMQDEDLNFSFSGLKTAALRQLESLSEAEAKARVSDLCASYQEAIVDVLVEKLARAARKCGAKNWTVTGGVSANSRLRARAQEMASAQGARLALPPLRYCTDNAAMIALAGLYRLRAGAVSPQDLSPSAASLPGDFQ
ncbi:MAG: tRNA (adenosine(37)-N6)-threonylcarbamoyltransferase complex transferase subunit TsaD [Bdellovibrionales bacterium]|nr:tRNA (adenosine(37)-N6)-threonylcarbamoyltransferase complex transferase subunit TsaD [Bdellovibrionales bacterium]